MSGGYLRYLRERLFRGSEESLPLFIFSDGENRWVVDCKDKLILTVFRDYLLEETDGLDISEIFLVGSSMPSYTIIPSQYRFEVKTL